MEPDGFIHIVGVNGKETTYYNKDYQGHSGYDSPYGLIIWFKTGRTFIPWVQILTMHLEYNSDEYVAWIRTQPKAKEQAKEAIKVGRMREARTTTKRDIIGSRVTGSGRGHLEEVPRDASDS